jgi:hypothetical protein
MDNLHVRHLKVINKLGLSFNWKRPGIGKQLGNNLIIYDAGRLPLSKLIFL